MGDHPERNATHTAVTEISVLVASSTICTFRLECFSCIGVMATPESLSLSVDIIEVIDDRFEGELGTVKAPERGCEVSVMETVLLPIGLRVLRGGP